MTGWGTQPGALLAPDITGSPWYGCFSFSAGAAISGVVV